MKRSRGRGRRPQQNGGGGGGGGGGHHHNHNRAFDSNGPDVKIRGTAANVYEKYLQLARDANSAGDRVQQENYLQHAEHYYRIMMAQGGPPVVQQPQQQGGQGQQPYVQGQPQANGNGNGAQPGNEAFAPQPGNSAPSYSLADGDDGQDGDDAG